MDRAKLCTAWGEIFKTPVPPRLSQPMMRRFLAFEVQARKSGGLPKGFAARLERAGRSRQHRTRGAPRVGARLTREWNGTTHILDVVEEGFLWRGNHYRSLSAIARAITGARWSGPRFFGLIGQTAK